MTAPEANTVLALLQQAEAKGESLAVVAARARARARGVSYPFAQLDGPLAQDRAHLLIPLEPLAVWGAGVTYRRSAEFRDAETNTPRGIYDKVYYGERPELFFKGTAVHCVGSNGAVSIRSDSAFTAPEPEVALVLDSRGQIAGYTLADDVSAWDIERENPLYLPQSKIFLGCCALGPVLVTADEIPDPATIDLTCTIRRGKETIFRGSTSIKQMRRAFAELVGFLIRHNPIPTGTVLMTGTGIIVENQHALRAGDVVEIYSEAIGLLRNPVQRLAA
ncbi:MAG: fumarylacetoacetate hydrolase family protein [Anaerolineae bacterium]|nr:fumarylacetoacetate hydrolase family protein [Anaerolineae bacterium]